ncbi:hypothetical protein D3C87_405740 [compost metagenome]
MKKYTINRGIGRTVEFRGLKAQYLFLFAGGLLGILILVMVLYMAGCNSYVCLAVGAGGAGLVVWQTAAMNRKYGEHGLMKKRAGAMHPRYIICRRAASKSIITTKRKEP